MRSLIPAPHDYQGNCNGKFHFFWNFWGEKKKKRVNIVHFYVAHLGAIRMHRSNGERLYVVQEFVKILLQTALFAWVRDAILCTASKPV